MRHHRRIDADRADSRHVIEPKRLDEIAAERIPGLGAEPLDAARRVVAGERGQVDAGDRLHQPRRLPFLLHRPPRGHRRGAPLDGGKVHARILDPVGMERRPLVPRPVRAECATSKSLVLRTQSHDGIGHRPLQNTRRASGFRSAGRAFLMNAILRLQCRALPALGSASVRNLRPASQR